MFNCLEPLREILVSLVQVIRVSNEKQKACSRFRQQGLNAHANIEQTISQINNELDEFQRNCMTSLRNLGGRTASYLSNLETPNRPPAYLLHVAEDLWHNTSEQVQEFVERVKEKRVQLTDRLNELDVFLDVLVYHSDNLSRLSFSDREPDEAIIAVVPGMQIRTEKGKVTGTFMLTSRRVIAFNTKGKSKMQALVPSQIQSNFELGTLRGAGLEISVAQGKWVLSTSVDALEVIGRYIELFNSWSSQSVDSPTFITELLANKIEVRGLRRTMETYLNGLERLLLQGSSATLRDMLGAADPKPETRTEMGSRSERWGSRRSVIGANPPITTRSDGPDPTMLHRSPPLHAGPHGTARLLKNLISSREMQGVHKPHPSWQELRQQQMDSIEEEELKSRRGIADPPSPPPHWREQTEGFDWGY